MSSENKKIKSERILSKTPVLDFKKYRGKQIAIVNGKVVAEGFSVKEVFKKAKALYPRKEIWLFSVPKEAVFIYTCK